jgi:hypothetical protein
MRQSLKNIKTLHFDYLGRTLVAKLDMKDKIIHSLKDCDCFDLGVRVATESEEMFVLAVQKYLTDEGYFI